MVQYVITPWRDRRELLQVRQQLYAPRDTVNDQGRRQAVSRVSVWMQRGNCPHLVESTAILTSARLNDVPGNSNYCVRAAYSAAFSRFVTGLLDSHQDKRRKLSMYSIAKTVGLPATFVELRHQATHEELPSISKLRTATQKALRWIWSYYWAKLAVDPADTENCITYLHKLLKEKDIQTRERMESKLRNWSKNEILSTLLEIDGMTDDPELLLKSLRLSKKLFGEDGDSEMSENDTAVTVETRDVEEIMAELAKMNEDLNDIETHKADNITAGFDPPATDRTDGRGWTLWRGPWQPTPIGTIC